MDLEELKERYKLLPLWARFLIAGILGLLPGAYVYYDEGDTLSVQLDEENAKETTVRAEFEKSRREKANLPKLEEELAFTEEQLIKAKSKLPDSYKIEEFLQKAATIAKEVGVKLAQFNPGEEKTHNDTYRYVELPIKTIVEGHFNQVASFFDRIVHLESSIFVRHIDMTKASVVVAANPDSSVAAATKTPAQIAREARQNLRVKAAFDMVVFRGMTEVEIAAAAAAEAATLKPGEAPPDGQIEKIPQPSGESASRGRTRSPDDMTSF